MKFMADKNFSEEQLVDMCPWFTVNKITHPCSCKEYSKGTSILVLVDNNCVTHGFRDNVDSLTQVKDNEHCRT